MRNLIEFIDDNSNVIEVKACCCGHYKYPMSIVVDDGEIFDLMSGIKIPRTRNFYRKDNQGYYYIPEVIENNKVS